MTLSITTIFYYVYCRVSFIVMLNVVMLNDFMLNVVMLNVVMLNDVMLNVVMLNVAMLNVVAPLPPVTRHLVSCLVYRKRTLKLVCVEFSTLS
jgi:hypothetical protein